MSCNMPLTTEAQMTNAPTFADYVAERVGHRNWYTRPRPAPVRSRGRQYITPRSFAAMIADYQRLFGVHPYSA